MANVNIYHLKHKTKGKVNKRSSHTYENHLFCLILYLTHKNNLQKTKLSNQLTTKCLFFKSFPTPHKESIIHKMSPTAPVTRLHDDILKNHTLTLMGLTCRGNVRIISHSHADPLHPIYYLWATRSVFGVVLGAVSQQHSHRGGGGGGRGEDRERLRKNGCKGGIQFREGVSTDVFRQRAELFHSIL